MLISSWGVGAAPLLCVFIPSLTSTGKGARGGKEQRAAHLALLPALKPFPPRPAEP